MALLFTGLLVATLIAAPTAPAAPAVPADAEQGAIDSSVAAASAAGIEQSVIVIDRATGATVASSGADQRYISESIVKLFTVAYYEVQAGGAPDAALSRELRTMIEQSDDDIESELWNVDIVPAMAQRYGLDRTSNGPKTGPHDWGWEWITAGDEGKFLFQMSNDPEVAPLLMDAMTKVGPIGSDGFDQDFGLNALPGEHGSKQGWTDDGEAADSIQIHSVGWTDQYFVAILQSSASADEGAMRASATSAAQAILGAEGGSPAQTAGTLETPAPSAAAVGPDLAPQFADAMQQLRHEVGALVQRITGTESGW